MSEKTDKILVELGYSPAKTKTPQPVTPDKVQNRDLFQTPNYAVDLLVPYIPSRIKWIWECAAGSGKIVNRLRRHGYNVIGSDLNGFEGHTANFIKPSYNNYPGQLDVFEGEVSIITNPPFSAKRKFYEACKIYGVPFALLIPAEYCKWIIQAVEDGAEKIIPTRRINYITPNVISRINSGDKASYTTIDEIPPEILYRYSSSDFHSMWLTWGFGIGKTETFVDLSLNDLKYNI